MRQSIRIGIYLEALLSFLAKAAKKRKCGRTVFRVKGKAFAALARKS